MKRFLLALAFLLIAFDASAQTIGVVKKITDTHRLPYDAASTSITSAFTPQTTWVRLLCTTACFVQTRVSGQTNAQFPAVAGGVTSSTPLAANVETYIPVSPDGQWRRPISYS